MFRIFVILKIFWDWWIHIDNLLPVVRSLVRLVWNCTHFAGHWPLVICMSGHQCQDIGLRCGLSKSSQVSCITWKCWSFPVYPENTSRSHIQRVHCRMLSFPRRREMDGSMEVPIKCISTVPVAVMDVKLTGISRTNNNEMVSAGDTEISLHIRAPWTLNLPSVPPNLTTFHYQGAGVILRRIG